MFLTSTNEVGINGSRAYGGEVYPATFEPACDAYAPITSSKDGSTTYSTNAASASLKAIFTLVNAQKQAQLPALFFKKVVNQPVFGDGKSCNSQLRIFNTSLSTGAYAPKAISANIRVTMPTIFTQAPRGEMFWDEAAGMQVDTPFIEQNLVSCEGFRGYIWEDDSPVKEEEGSRTMEEEAWGERNQNAAMQSRAPTFDTMLADYPVSPANKQLTM